MTVQDVVISALAFIICLVAIACFYVLVRRNLSLREKALLSDERDQRIAIREREAALAISKATATQLVELEKARLLSRVAKERVAAKLAEDPRIVSALTGEELKIIAARKIARVKYVREHGAEDDAAKIEALLLGYKAALKKSYYTYDSWFGNTVLSGLSPGVVERLVKAYIDSLENANNSFSHWYGRIDPRAFQ